MSDSREADIDIEVESPQKVKEFKAKKNLHLLSFGSFCVYSAYISMRSLISQIYDRLQYENIGIWIVMTQFLVQTIVNIFSQKLLRLFPPHISFMLSGIGYSLTILGSVITISSQDSTNYRNQIIIVNFIFFIISGISNATFYTNQADYISKLSPLEERGKDFSIFNYYYLSSLIVGGIAGAFIISLLSTLAFFQVCFCLGIFGSILWIGLQDSALIDKNEKIQLNQTENIKKQENCIEVFKTLKEYDFVKLIPLPIIKGIVIGFYTSHLGEIVKNCTLNEGLSITGSIVDYRTSILLIIYGICQIFGGYLAGQLTDKCTIYTAILTTVIIGYIAIFTSIIVIQFPIYTLTFIMTLFWGILDGCDRVLNQSLISKTYKGSVEHLAMNRILQGASCALAMLLTAFFKNSYTYFYILIAFLVILSLHLLNRPHKQNDKNEITT